MVRILGNSCLSDVSSICRLMYSVQLPPSIRHASELVFKQERDVAVSGVAEHLNRKPQVSEIALQFVRNKSLGVQNQGPPIQQSLHLVWQIPTEEASQALRKFPETDFAYASCGLVPALRRRESIQRPVCVVDHRPATRAGW